MSQAPRLDDTEKDSATTLDRKLESGPKISPEDPVQLDKHGLPLVPQPSTDPSDPLNWPQWLKIAILLQASTMALLGPFNQAVINPAFVPLGAEFHKTTVQASYLVTISIAFAGAGSFLWIPLANTYGRRPVMLLATLIAAASSLGSAKSTTWTQLIATRVFNGIGASAFFTLGAAIVVDIFFLHERGRAMGIFTVFLSNSGHIAPFPGGFLGQYVSWRWCFYLPACCDLFMFSVMLFCLPETLYVRGSAPVVTRRPILRRMGLWNLRPDGHHLEASHFLRPFLMFQYLAIIFPAWFYAWTFAISSILPAVTSAVLFHRYYNFNVVQTGLALGGGTLVGGVLGESLGGAVIDRILRKSRERAGGHDVEPEVRFKGIWPGLFLVPAGILIWGFCIEYRTPWIGPVVGFGTTCFALQIISTVIYAYCSDCYKPQTPEVSQALNFTRQTVGMTVSFWAIRFGEKVGFHLMSVTLALLTLVFFAPMILLIRNGKAIRFKQGMPSFNRAL